jgi:uncharacterized protein
MKHRVLMLAAAAALAVASGCKKNDHASPASASAGGSAAAGSDAGSAAAGSGSAAAAGSGSAAATVAPLARPFFFAAKKDGHTVYLFGTVHLGVEPAAIPDWVLAKLDGATAFAMETDIQDPSMMTALMRTDGTTLDQELGAETWKKFQAAVGDKMANGFRRIKTSAAATVLDVQGMKITQPMDLFLLMRAKDAKKHIVYLEPAAKQMALLDKWMDARALREMLDSLDEAKQKNQELVDAYRAGDADKVLAMSQDDSDFKKMGRSHAEFEQMMKELLFDRNASWIPELEDMSTKGDAFVAVGAMHLLGPGSVVDLLGKAGFDVTRLSAP